ncbi:helix-turn-helix domain-containing protein [Candidatus Palauibacter sp.]|uniref:helix-turn-helix domain-containing protein n=1 Tax=Candidatus Palauibacter sp. TaxID=3101350 RepID=UPI003B59B918
MNDLLLVAFGEALRAKRKERGLSQEELAARASLDRSYVGGVERGERNISLINLNKLARALDLTLAELLADLRRTSR